MLCEFGALQRYIRRLALYIEDERDDRLIS